MNVSETSFLEAVDYQWNHKGDYFWEWRQGQKPIHERVGKIVSDYVVFIFAYLLGLNNLENKAIKRTSAQTKEDYEKYVKERQYSKPKNSSVILVLMGEDDLVTSPATFEELERQSGYKVVFEKMDLDLFPYRIDALKKNSSKIEALWIRTHGMPTQMIFDCYGSCIEVPKHSWEEKQLKIYKTFKTQFSKLEEQAPIILESCHTGQEIPSEKGETQENIAQVIARLAGGRTVYAPSREALPIDRGVTFSKDEGFSVTMKSTTSCKSFGKGSLLGRLCAVWHLFRDHEEAVTRKFSFKPTG